jgi:membrane-associated protease RseP (regulator of RpoE activity)
MGAWRAASGAMTTWRRAVAIHEAGHAVVALKLGCDIVRIGYCFEDDEVAGECEWQKPHKHERRSWLACVPLGGVFAMKLWARDFVDFDELCNFKHCDQDWANFQKTRGGMSYRACRRLVLQILRENEALVLALASTMERDGFADQSNFTLP